VQEAVPMALRRESTPPNDRCKISAREVRNLIKLY